MMSLRQPNVNTRLKNVAVPTNQSIMPKPSLAFFDAVALIVGIVIGAGIFETPALVAANAGGVSGVILMWLLGGAISLVGALC